MEMFFRGVFAFGFMGLAAAVLVNCGSDDECFQQLETRESWDRSIYTVCVANCDCQ